MIQLPYVLVFTDKKERASELEALSFDCGLTSVATKSPSRAEEWLDQLPVILVIMTWSTSDIAPRQLLSVLRRRFSRVLAVVHDEAVRDHQVLRSIHAIHPLAVTIDPALGQDYLGSRIAGILGRTVGDLCLRDGVVVHQPTGEVFSAASVAPQLVAAYPHPVRLENSSAAMGVLRFRRWLEECGSCVSVENERGTGEYRVAVKESFSLAKPLDDAVSSKRLAS